jgi:hypothetical protein
MRWRTVVTLDVQGLKENPRVKRPIVAELEQLPNDQLNVSSFLRDYIEQLSHVHGTLRALCPEVDAWRATIEATLLRCQQATGEPVLHINAYAEDERGGSIVNLTVFTQPLERLAFLRQKNAPLANLALRYVSNEG